jgi:hypothetical protein
MKVLYTEFSEPHWVIVAKRLQERANWHPVRWIAEGRMKEPVNDAFGDGMFVDRIDAMRLRKSVARASLSVKLLERLASSQVHALKMMGRMDASGRDFSFEERLDYYYQLLSYYNALLERDRPDLVCFLETPHVIYDYVLYALCRAKAVPTLMFMRMKVGKYVCVTPTFENGPLPVVEALNERGDAVLPESLIAERKRLRGNYEEGMPEQQRTLHQATNSKGTTGAWWSIIRERLRPLRSHYASYLKAPGKHRMADGLTQLDYRRSKWLGMKARRANERAYRALAEPADFERPFVYVPLNYQPEKTTSPDAGWFSDMRLMVRELSAAIPADWLLYVREHPVSFFDASGSGRGHMMRSPGFYEDLAELPNVQLVALEDDSFRLIDHAQAIATATGTAAWEAVNRGKPAICFGVAWFYGCPGVYQADRETALLDLIAQVQANPRVTDEDVEHYWLTVTRSCREARINTSRHHDPVDTEENITILTDLLSKGYQTYHSP